MAYQNINQYNYRRWGLKFFNEITDFCLASDERDYNEDVIFSPYLIGEFDGNRMPIKMDFNSTGTTICRDCGDFDYETLVSENYWNPLDIDPNICPVVTEICDVGLTGIDNGLTKELSGITITATTGLYTITADTYNRYKYDRRFKAHPISGHTTPANRLWNDDSYNYDIEWVSEGGLVGSFARLKGGFYQGFYKLAGYDYEVYPERNDYGWTVEMLLKYRWTGDTSVGLNNRYPDNKGTFFFMGARAENKFYHYASGSPKSDSGYTRVTSGLTCMKTCACATETGKTGNSCFHVYQMSGTTNKPCGCQCSCTCHKTILPEPDPLYDGVSNGMSVRLSGDTGNPRVCVKEYLITGRCEPVSACTTEEHFVTGVTIHEWCSTKGIFDACDLTPYIEQENWVQLDLVFQRNEWFDCGDLFYLGGNGQIVFNVFTATTAGNSISLVMPPITHKVPYDPAKEIEVKINDLWLQQRNFRMGKFKVYVNGKLLMVIDDFEEIIPRPLNTQKEKQVGVPFNISIGGGTQGLKDNLTFSGTCPTDLNHMVYQQDPECLTTEDLTHTIYSGLTTHIHLEEVFGGSFIGDISAFRMYTEPLDASMINHNFRILKDKYDLLNFDCLNCGLPPAPSVTATPTPTQTPTATVTPTQTPTATVTPTQTHTPTQTSTITPTITQTITQTATASVTPTITSTITPSVTSSETPTNTPTVTQTPTITASVTVTSTPTYTPSSTETPTETPTNTPTPSITSSPGSSATPTPTETPTQTPTLTQTPTVTKTVTPTFTPTETPTDTPTQTPTETPTETPTQTPTLTSTITETPTSTPTETPTSTVTSSVTPTPTLSPTLTPDSNFLLQEDLFLLEQENRSAIIIQFASPTPTNTPTQTLTPTATIGTVTIDLEGEYSPGSINALYTATANTILGSDVEIFFVDTFGTTTGDSISLSGSVIINSGSSFGTSYYTIPGDYTELNKVANFSGVTYQVTGSSITVQVITNSVFDVTPTPTLTPTNTQTPTVTQIPTITETPTNTITPTPSTTPSIVTSGLIIQLDAYDNESYPGTGTTVFDITSGFNHTLIGATYTVLNGVKCFDCTTGTNRVAVNGTGPLLPNSGYTYITWARLITSTAGFRTLLYTNSPKYTPITIPNASNTLGYWDTSFKSSGYDVASSAAVWVQFAVVGTNTSQTFYINGSQVGSTISAGAGGTTHWGWGNNDVAGQPWGHVANMYFYNRQLSLAEITQQYNFLAPRFVELTPTSSSTSTPTVTPTRTSTPTVTPTNTPTTTTTPTPTSTPNTPVTSNLRLYYDPSNPLSYSGSGTVINDLSGNGLNGTMSNITFTSPYFSYNGSSSQIQVADNVLLEPGSGDWTMEVWVNQSVLGNDVVLGKFDNGGLTVDVSYSIRTTNTTYYAQLGSGSGSGSSLFVNSTNYVGTIDTWYQIVYVFTNVASNTLQTFVNGVSIGSVSHSLASILNTTSPLYIGSYNGGEFPQWFDGKIGITRLYNAALTSSQVLQNFNADKSKYGL